MYDILILRETQIRYKEMSIQSTKMVPRSGTLN